MVVSTPQHRGRDIEHQDDVSAFGSRGHREELDPVLQRRHGEVLRLWQKYKNVFEQTQFGHNKQLRETEEWMRRTKLTSDRNDQESIVHREEFFHSESAQAVIRYGLPVYQAFQAKMREATPYISRKSQERWKERFYDESLNIQAKKYWVEHQMPSYMKAWKQVAEERETLIKDPAFKELVSLDQSYSVILKKEDFLDMHFEKKKGLLADARSAIAAAKKLRTDLHTKAKAKLGAAAGRKILAEGKVGVWLERIFTANATSKEIQAFLDGNGQNSLQGLSENWMMVKMRYDTIADKLSRQPELKRSRGLKLISESQFLSMHFRQREIYVAELEDRIEGSENIGEVDPCVLKIRHAMDIRDWEQASAFILEAKTNPELSEKDLESIRSMERYVEAFGGKQKASKKPQEGVDVGGIRREIDEIVSGLGQTHSEVQPLVERLLLSLHSNRSIHQLRWITYNNDWCRTHGFLDDERARQGASKENEELTRMRGLNGEDVGRNDVLGHTTAGQQFFRKKEFANHKPTLLHTNVQSGAAITHLAERLELEQDPRVLYWTTLNCYNNDGPKNANWHKDLFLILTKLRSLTAKLKTAGFRYGGLGKALISLN